MPLEVESFFQGYVEAFNRSLGDEIDIEGIRSHFSDCFVAAGPASVKCGDNSEVFAETLRQGYTFYQSIGTRAMAVRSVTSTPIDDSHQMARVEYRATYERPSGEIMEIDFAVSYFLAQNGQTYKIFGFVAGDEMAMYQQHGLLAESKD